jgi:uncharacterized protein YbcI
VSRGGGEYRRPDGAAVGSDDARDVAGAKVGEMTADPRAEEVAEPRSVSARVSQVVVGAMKDLYGRGPVHAKTYFCDEYIFCTMSGGFTRDEETMIRAGEHDAVRDYRLTFQRVIAPELIRRVEDVVGRRIVGYHSQVLFDPDRLIEIFLMDPVEEASPTSAAEDASQ